MRMFPPIAVQDTRKHHGSNYFENVSSIREYIVLFFFLSNYDIQHSLLFLCPYLNCMLLMCVDCLALFVIAYFRL